MTWQEAISAYRAVFGVKADTSDLASTDIGQRGSEPASMASTSTEQRRSLPNGAGSNQHQTMPVETTSGCDQLQAMTVFLSTNPQEEGAEARLGLAASSPEGHAKAWALAPAPGITARRSTKSEDDQQHQCQVRSSRSSQPEDLPPGLPAWAAELRNAADIDQYLATPHGCLPPDVSAKLREAADKGMDDHLAEVARKLSALRGLGLDDDQIRDHVIGARDYVFANWAEKRVAKGTLTEEEADCTGVTSMPPGGFARGLATALAKRAEWTKRDTASGKAQLDRQRLSSSSDRELAALLANPMWSVGRTPATNADLIDLCEEFPAMRPNRLRQLLIDAYAGLASSTSDVIALSDLLEDTRDAVRQELDEQRAKETVAEDPVQPRDCESDEHAAQTKTTTKF